MVTDRRTDIWAFGAVFLEMLTGRRPFAGDDLALTLAAVVKEEPDWTGLPEEARPLRHVLARCLTKDPRQRFHHIADVRIAIEDCLAGPPSPDEGAASARRTTVTGIQALGRTAVLVVVAALAAVVTWALASDTTPQRMVQSSVLPPDDAAFVSSAGPTGAFPISRSSV